MDVCEMNDDIDKVIIGAGIGTVGAMFGAPVLPLHTHTW